MSEHVRNHQTYTDLRSQFDSMLLRHCVVDEDQATALFERMTFLAKGYLRSVFKGDTSPSPYVTLANWMQNEPAFVEQVLSQHVVLTGRRLKLITGQLDQDAA